MSFRRGTGPRLRGPSLGLLKWTGYVEAVIDWAIDARKRSRGSDPLWFRVLRRVLLSVAIGAFLGARLAGLL
jgi:hypothetical protein